MLRSQEHFEMSEHFFNAVAALLATSEKADDFLGVPVLVSKLMPQDLAMLVDKNGKIIQMFKLG